MMMSMIAASSIGHSWPEALLYVPSLGDLEKRPARLASTAQQGLLCSSLRLLVVTLLSSPWSSVGSQDNTGYGLRVRGTTEREVQVQTLFPHHLPLAIH